MTANDKDNDHTESINDSGHKPDQPLIQQLGPFKIETTLGSGGMGTIYKAYDESMNRTVALKVLHSSLGISENAQSRFIREAWIAGQLDHPNIIKVHSRGEENGINYFAMELADGGSLADLIQSKKRIISERADINSKTSNENVTFILERFVELSNALEQIHSKGFIHRDIKPQNILISGQNKKFKFTDFGIAHADDMTQMTRAGDFIGTIHYMSPELLTAHRATVDKRTDIYSLGATLYEVISLSTPFQGDTEEKYISEILSGHVIPLRKRNPRIPKQLETIIMKCMHHDPEKRYQSSLKLADDLQRLLNNQPIKAKRENLPTIVFKFFKRNSALSLTVIVTSLIIISSLWWLNQIEQNKQDALKINSILETVLETGVSPYAIDPEWNRLSEIVFDGLENDPTSETSVLLLKCMNLLKYKVMEHGLFESAQYRVDGKEIEGITDVAYERWKYDELRHILKKTRYYASIDGGEEKLVGVGEGEMYHTGYGISFYLKNLTQDNSEGIHHLLLRWETAMYYQSGLSILLSNGQWEELNNGFYCADSESPDSIYEITSKKLSKPFYSYSQQKTSNTWVHDKYPVDFPKEVFDSSLVQIYNSKFQIDTVRLTKVPVDINERQNYHMTFLGSVETSLPYPIAAKFELRLKDDLEPLVTGGLFVFDDVFDFFYLKAEQFIEGGTSSTQRHNHNNKYSVFSVSSGFEIMKDSIFLESLGLPSIHIGILKLIPSHKVASRTNNYEYWGGVIEIPVVIHFSKRQK